MPANSINQVRLSTVLSALIRKATTRSKKIIIRILVNTRAKSYSASTRTLKPAENARKIMPNTINSHIIVSFCEKKTDLDGQQKKRLEQLDKMWISLFTLSEKELTFVKLFSHLDLAVPNLFLFAACSTKIRRYKHSSNTWKDLHFWCRSFTFLKLS